MNPTHKLPPSQQIALVADELRTIANNGLLFAQSPYDAANFTRIRALAAHLYSLVAAASPAEIEVILAANPDVLTPMAVVDTAVLDEQVRILLVQRSDDGLWAMPGGACEVGETPAQGGAREVREETGMEVEITRLLGVFDSRVCGTVSQRHLYHFLFAAVPTGGDLRPSHETPDVRWWALEDIPWQSLSPGHSLRLQQVLHWQLNPGARPYFDRE